MAVRYTTTTNAGSAVHQFRRRGWEKADRELYGPAYDDYDWKERELHIVARDGKAVVGYAGLWMAGGVCILEELIVHDKHRGKGIGRYLIKRVEQVARKQGCHKIRLETDDRLKPAIALYKSAGFIKEASLPYEGAKGPTAVYGKRLT